jgi:hypothetical protein
VGLRIFRSAHKDGATDADIRHVLEHAIYAGEPNDQQVLYLGPDASGNLLEVVVAVRDDGTEVVVHAMRMRKRYRTLLTGGERGHE